MAKSVGNTRRIPAGKTQVNFNIGNDTLEQVKNLAYWENTTQSEIYSSSVTKFIKAFERKNGKIKPIPPRKGFDNL
jgi:hypothetical protein